MGGPYVLVILIIPILLEMIYARWTHRRIYSIGENRVTLIILAINILYSIFKENKQLSRELFSYLKVFDLGPTVFRFYQSNSTSFLDESPFLRAFLIFFIVDFLYYTSHRLTHKINLLWCSHFTHHSFTKINILAGARDPLTFFRAAQILAIVFLLPTLLRYSMTEILTAALVIRLYAQWVHCPFIPKLGFLEKFFVTPSHHRMHHLVIDHKNPSTVNYGGVLIIWDKMFGTFREEVSGSDHKYGVAEFSGSSIFFQSLFYPHVQLFKSLKKCRTMRDLFSIFFWKI